MPDAVPDDLIKAAGMRMPFGRFKGTRLIDLPEPYVVWFKNEGFPRGQLGARLALIYEIKANGLEKLVRPLLESSETAGGDSEPIPDNDSDPLDPMTTED